MRKMHKTLMGKNEVIKNSKILAPHRFRPLASACTNTQFLFYGRKIKRNREINIKNLAHMRSIFLRFNWNIKIQKVKHATKTPLKMRQTFGIGLLL